VGAEHHKGPPAIDSHKVLSRGDIPSVEGTVLVIADVNNALLSYRGDERRGLLFAELSHFWDCSDESRGVIGSTHCRGKNEFSDSMTNYCPALQRVVSDSLISCKKNPTAVPNLRKPALILGTAFKVVKVTLEANFKILESFQ